MKKILIIGHGETREPLVHVAQELRDRGRSPDCYFNGDIDYLLRSEDNPSADFLLLGLCRAGREVSSAEYERERRLMGRIHSMPVPIPCGVLRDVHGFISAHYLGKYGSLMRLIFTDNRQIAPLGVFEKFELVKFPDPHVKAGLVAEAIVAFLQSGAKPVRMQA